MILRNKTMLVCEQLRLGDLTITQVLQGIDDPIERVNLAIGIVTNLVYQGQGNPKGEILQSFAAADSLLDAFPLAEKNPTAYFQDSERDQRICVRLLSWLTSIFRQQNWTP